jgi:TPR repeat protein
LKLLKVSQICLLICVSWWAILVQAEPFDAARVAAEEGRYEDVVKILSELINAGGLDDPDKVIAHSNRGIAYSLLETYDLARQDLNTAIQLDPAHALTRNHLGILAEHVDGDIPTAIKWYERAAGQGFAPAQTNLGDLYLAGKASTGVRREDYVIAADWYQKAIAQNYMLARVSLGIMYRDGLGVKADPEAAVGLFTEAAQASSPDAHYLLGSALESGQGVKRDYTSAAAHYQVAAEAGIGRAQNALGYLYRRGAGVPKNYEAAIKWYRLASAQGIIEATNRLAWLLATCPEQRFCNGAEALDLATAAVRQNSSPGYLDTLAAAQARVGNFAEAIALIESLLQQLDPDSDNYKRYTTRLDDYQAHRPFQSD